MLLSCEWLREFVPYEGTAEELGRRLTMLGLELEEIRRPYEGIKDIIVGHVVECAPHPESDHLSVCSVDAGQEALLDIVCGAPNVARGQKVPVALAGTVMPDGMVVKKAKLRGRPSHGMICSERELGLAENHDGIMVLPESAPVGRRLVDTLELDTEVLDVGVTPNRADCMSVLGLAREAALAFDLPLTLPSFALEEQGEDASAAVCIEIADADLCPLYQGRIIENVRVAPSPMRLRHRLHVHGIRPVSNVVDATNYVLLELGQPLHAFDLDKIRGGRIAAAPARNGEILITLDGQERRLTAEDLTIRDAEGPMALAGVMGGLDSEITDRSVAVFLESAVFRPASIRKTARRLGISSEASYRFERGVDQVGNTLAMNRAAAMIAALCAASGGRVRRGVCRSEPRPWTAPRMTFRPARAAALLGVDPTPGFSAMVLEKLGCVVERSGDAWQTSAPSWRHDLTREADLVEEVGRAYGLDRIPPTLPPVARRLESAGAPESVFAFWSRIKRWGQGLGLNEVVNYSFVGHADLDHLGLPRSERISIVNPLSAEQNALRTALAPGLLQNLRHNLGQGNMGLRLFELAHAFTADPASETSACEKAWLGLLLYGPRFDGAWPQTTGEADYSDIKGVVEHLSAFLHVSPPVCVMEKEHPFLLPCVRLTVDGTDVGVMGRAAPAMAEAFHARKDVWLAELDLDALRVLHEAAQVRFRPLPVFPPVRRDVTVMTPLKDMTTVGAVLDHVRNMDLPLLEDMILIDCFEPEGGLERNLTFRLTFRHSGRTLKDDEVDKEREKVAQSLMKRLGVKI